MKICVLDVESAGVESTSVCLSIAILFAELDKKQYSIDQLYKDTFFVKLSVADQMNNYKRVIDPDTMSWWKRQSIYARETSLIPTKNDLSLEDGIRKCKEYINSQCNPKKTLILTRGSLDQMIVDSMCRMLKEPVIFPYNQYMDIRTMINILSDESSKGFCAINTELFPDYDETQIVAHDPCWDIVKDFAQIRTLYE